VTVVPDCPRGTNWEKDSSKMLQKSVSTPVAFGVTNYITD